MFDFKSVLEALALDTTLGEAFGPYATLAFIGLAATLVGVTLGVAVRGMIEQIRGPEPSDRPAAVVESLRTHDEAHPATAA